MNTKPTNTSKTESKWLLVEHKTSKYIATTSKVAFHSLKTVVIINVMRDFVAQVQENDQIVTLEINVMLYFCRTGASKPSNRNVGMEI